MGRRKDPGTDTCAVDCDDRRDSQRRAPVVPSPESGARPTLDRRTSWRCAAEDHSGRLPIGTRHLVLESDVSAAVCILAATLRVTGRLRKGFRRQPGSRLDQRTIVTKPRGSAPDTQSCYDGSRRPWHLHLGSAGTILAVSLISHALGRLPTYPPNIPSSSEVRRAQHAYLVRVPPSQAHHLCDSHQSRRLAMLTRECDNCHLSPWSSCQLAIEGRCGSQWSAHPDSSNRHLQSPQPFGGLRARANYPERLRDRESSPSLTCS
jgi:hypothetical protein